MSILLCRKRKSQEMNTTTKTREYREGWLGRRRTYTCRKCRSKFQVDTKGPLPENKRICPKCSGPQPCEGCGRLPGQGLTAIPPERYRGYLLCRDCIQSWKVLEKEAGRETTWDQFLDPAKLVFKIHGERKARIEGRKSNSNG